MNTRACTGLAPTRPRQSAALGAETCCCGHSQWQKITSGGICAPRASSAQGLLYGCHRPRAAAAGSTQARNGNRWLSRRRNLHPPCLYKRGKCSPGACGMRETPCSTSVGITPAPGGHPAASAPSTRGCTPAAGSPKDGEAAAFATKWLFSLAGAGEHHVSPAWPAARAKPQQPERPQTAPAHARLLKQPLSSGCPGGAVSLGVWRQGGPVSLLTSQRKGGYFCNNELTPGPFPSSSEQGNVLAPVGSGSQAPSAGPLGITELCSNLPG